ncbi:MAG: acetate--CoA ligase [Pseudobacteriovorax sp.]|nr:acetate--CoA ligase [Pseudobacteriovorax sp.]
MSETGEISSILNEQRLFSPSVGFSENSQIGDLETYRNIWNYSKNDPEGFWGRKAEEMLDWFQPWTKVLEWDEPHAKWFTGGRINASYNCLDRHVKSYRRNKAAIIWEGEPGDKRTLTYQQLLNEVCRCANAMKSLGVKKGDRVTIYLPLTPELSIATLACARIGAIHSVVFAGFSSHALAERNNDAESKLIITADGGWRKGAITPLKQNVDECLAESPTVENVIVLKRTGQDITMQPGRDHWWHDVVDSKSHICEALPLDSEHPLFLLYTSGSTGKPKGILHTTGGYLLGATLSTKFVFDLKENDVFWCTADVGWITGHSYLVYGPLSNGATTFMYEGAPNFPDAGRFWKMIETYQINTFYTAPTAIRAFLKAGSQWPNSYDLSSLRLLGTVGEPINPEAWMWYREVIGGNRCPIVDTWWQTETGSIMITPLPGSTPTVPGSATLPFFGVVPEIVDANGKPVPVGSGGYLTIKQPWPSMLRTIHGDDERYKRTYWSKFPGRYFTGDGARMDKNGYYWIMGRIDDVINVSGHRLSTMEVESALVSHPSVAEAAVVGIPHEIKGEAIVCFVSLDSYAERDEALEDTLKSHVTEQIGALARPESIRIAETLPKTRSGKIMRRLLRDVASGRDSGGDISTLEDTQSLESLR